MALAQGIPSWVAGIEGGRNDVPGPVTEYHVHLEGCLTAEDAVDFARRYKPDLLADGEEAYRASLAFSDFSGFIRAFSRILMTLPTPAAWGEATRRVLERARDHGIQRTLMFLSPMTPVRIHGLDRTELWREVARAAADTDGIEAAFVVDLVRSFRDDEIEADVELLRREAGFGLVGVGIGGPELQGPPERFASYFRTLRERGLLTTAHAGEGATPQHRTSLFTALTVLKPRRIGHGCAAAGDTALLDALAASGAVVDVSPASTRLTASEPDPERPARHDFARHGIPYTLNTDDPGLFGCTLAGERATGGEQEKKDTETQRHREEESRGQGEGAAG